MFSAIDTSLSLLGSEDEDINTVVSGTATGLLYKSTGKFSLKCVKQCLTAWKETAK